MADLTEHTIRYRDEPYLAFRPEPEKISDEALAGIVKGITQAFTALAIVEKRALTKDKTEPKAASDTLKPNNW